MVHPPTVPGRPLRVVIEDPALIADAQATPTDAIEGPWGPSVRAAWAEASTQVVDATGVAATDPTERLHHRIGAAIQRLWPASGAVE